MSWTFVGHVHTRHSLDSLNDPAALARHAVALGVDVLAVTDHDTWQGAIDTRDAARKLGLPLTVIVGSEVSTDQGDVIGLFLRTDLREKRAPAFCDAVHAAGGLIWLPHPYKWHRLDDALLRRCDLIEVHNGRTSRADNTRAQELARLRSLPELAGPDAHRLADVGTARVVFEGDKPATEDALQRALLDAPRRFEIRPSSIWSAWLSQGVKFLRQPTFEDAYWLVRGAVRRVVKPGEYHTG